ncbi:hypothetical protein LMG9446_0094 [Lactococcus lactis subsp. lactis]|nr:hypothetical protein LKF67_0879 [Lactococcus lactis subsp. lactis]KST97316.1 hypothetical protein KF146_0443 [Lactococcus lactis subsp. lactis]KST99589.1 hypothetical protein KF196_0946 [Lactococcus lactis subsp. lactis]KSU17331.1 hypothetical protein LMG9446_0094 [Lactococcus lactis subsp. lactis]
MNLNVSLNLFYSLIENLSIKIKKEGLLLWNMNIYLFTQD